MGSDPICKNSCKQLLYVLKYISKNLELGGERAKVFMDNNYRYYDDEREIDLLDVLGRLIAKWRVILVIAIIGLLVGGIVSLTKGYSDMKRANAEAERISSQNQETILAERLLGEEDGAALKEFADKNLMNYVGIQTMYDMQKEYNEKSLYKNLDANNIAKVNLTYYVDNHYSGDSYNNLEDIIDAYKVILTSDEVCKEIIAATGLDTEPKYLRELIVIEAPAAVVNAGKGVGASIAVINSAQSATGNLSINVLFDDPKVSVEIANCLKKIVERVTGDISSSYGKVDASLQNDQLYMESDFDVMEDQNKADGKLVECYNNLLEIDKSMEGTQADYFKALVDNYNLEAEIASNGVSGQGFSYYVSKVMILIAAVAGAFVVVMFYGVLYLFDGKVKTGDELASLSHSTLLGTVLVDNDKKRKPMLFDKWAIALTDKKTMCEDSDRMLKTITASVIQYLKANNLNSVLFAGADIAHADVIDKIKGEIASAGYSVNVAIDAFDSPETVNSINDSDAVVFIGETCNSKYKKLERALSLCRLYKKSIMGTVAIQERI